MKNISYWFCLSLVWMAEDSLIWHLNNIVYRLKTCLFLYSKLTFHCLVVSVIPGETGCLLQCQNLDKPVSLQILCLGSTQILVHLHVNKTSFHMKGFALGLALKQRRKATRKSPIELNNNLSRFRISLTRGRCFLFSHSVRTVELLCVVIPNLSSKRLWISQSCLHVPVQLYCRRWDCPSLTLLDGQWWPHSSNYDLDLFRQLFPCFHSFLRRHLQ